MALQTFQCLARLGSGPTGQSERIAESLPLGMPGTRCSLVLPYHRSLELAREVLHPAGARDSGNRQDGVALVR